MTSKWAPAKTCQNLCQLIETYMEELEVLGFFSYYRGGFRPAFALFGFELWSVSKQNKLVLNWFGVYWAVVGSSEWIQGLPNFFARDPL